MAKLEFKVSANKQPVDDLSESIGKLKKQVERLQKSDLDLDRWTNQFEKFKRELKEKAAEIESVKTKITSFNNWDDKKGLDKLAKQLDVAKNKYDLLAQKTVDTFNDFQSSANRASAELLSAQKNVDSITWKLIDQKKVVADLQSEIRILNEAYRSADKENKPLISSQITSKKKQLEDERISLNNLRSEQERARLTVKGLKDEMSGYDRVINSLTNAQEKNEISLKKLLATFGGIAAVKSFISDMVRVRGEFQKTQMAFETMLGSKEKADMLMSQMVHTAAKTPFDLQGVANGAKQLLAYGTAAENVNDTLVRLGNIASGLSIPLGDLVYLYGTTQTQGRLFTQDVRQFMGRGIPLVKELASLLGKTEEEINKMVTAGQIGFTEVEKVIKKMTDEGGQFYNLMEKQSQTLSGQISNLGDAWDQMLNSIGEDTQGVASVTISMATGVVENYERVGKVLVSLIALYGVHKAAIIAVNVATNGLTMAENLLYLKSEALVKINKLLNATMLSNPYVLLATIVASFAATMWVLHDSTTAAEKAQKQLNKEQEEAARRKQELASKTDSLISNINSETESVYSQVKAYKELIKLFPELGNMSFEEFKNMPQDQQKKIFSNINDNREMDDAVRAYEADLKRIENLKKKIQETEDSPYNKSDNSWIHDVERLNKQLETTNNLAKLHKEEIEKIKQLQWEANTPVEEKVKYYKGIQSQLEKERDELNSQINPCKVLKTYTEDMAGSWFDVKDIIGNIKLDVLNKQIDETTGKINSLTGNNTPAVQNKAYWEKKKKDAEAARDALDVSKKNSEDWNKYTREIQQAQKEISKYDTTDKAENDINKRLKLQQELNRSILDSELKLQASRISAMEDGKAKRIALAHQETKDTIAAIQKEKEEYQRKIKESKGKEDSTVLTTFDNRELTAKEKEKADIARIEKEYAEEYKQRTKALTDVFLNEEQRKLSAIKTRYAEERKWADQQLKTGGMTKDQHKSYTTTIDKAQQQETYRSLLDNLNDFKQKEKDLRDKWDTDISAAVESKDAYLVAKLMEGKQKALSALNGQMLQESDEWQQLFGNLDNLTVQQLEKLSNTIKEKAKGLKLNPIDAQAVTNSLKEVDEKIRTMTPFGLLSKHLKEYKKAEDDLTKKNALKEMFRDTAASIDMVKGGFDAVVDGLNDMGLAGDEATQQLLSDLSNLMGSASQLATSIASTNPVGIIQGSIGVLTSVFNIFNNDKRHEKKIKALQDQIDTLDKSYQSLDKAINKAFSNDASKLIEDQNKLLEQQKILIQQQIREEQDKKKSDKDRIKEWQDQIDEINDAIADNKEKAKDAIFGEDLKSAIDDFAQAYVDAWAAGEDRAKSMKDIAKNMIKQMIVELIKSKDGIGPAVEQIRDKLLEFWKDGVITGGEQAIIDKMVEDAANSLDSKLGWADKYLKGDDSSKSIFSSDSISDTIIDGLKSGKSGIKDFASSFEDMMREAVLNNLKTKYLEGPLKEFQKKFSELSESGGQLTEAEIEELRNMYADIISGAKDQFDSLKEISGLDFTNDSDNTLKGASAKASQESITLLAGQTGAVRVLLEDIRGSMQPIREQMRLIYEMQSKGWEDVKAIRELTVKIDKNSEQVTTNTRMIHEVASKISENTRGTVDALEGTINVKVKM